MSIPRKISAQYLKRASAMEDMFQSFQVGELWHLKTPGESFDALITQQTPWGAVRLVRDGSSSQRSVILNPKLFKQFGFVVAPQERGFQVAKADGTLVWSLTQKEVLFRPGGFSAFVRDMDVASKWSWKFGGKERQGTVIGTDFDPSKQILIVEFAEHLEIEFGQGIGKNGSTYTVYLTPTKFQTWTRLG